MIQVRKSSDRGHADHGWLDARHTFSFSEYYDPAHMGFSALRVINEDRIEGGEGFPTHGHKNMEIITYIIEGALEHKDSMGHSTVIRPGEVQIMSAGTGVRHSEFNHFKYQKTHLLQIWILPQSNEIKPAYGQISFQERFKTETFIKVVSNASISSRSEPETLFMHQEAEMYVGKTSFSGEKLLRLQPHRNAWVQVVKGQLLINETKLEAGDGAAIQQVSELHFSWSEAIEFIVFDLP
jgi:redox-sensitive bicupin YhaK (pirin superfamily)